MRRLWGACAVGAWLAVASAPAGADSSIDSARAAVDASDYINARTQLDAVLAKGGHSPEDLAEIYRLKGVVAGALNETKAAVDAFQRCLALSPKCALPPGTSPRITRPFTTAQDFFKTREPIKIKSETDPKAPSVTVVIASDPIAMIETVRVRVVVDGAPEVVLDSPVKRSAASGTEPVTVALPPGKRLDLRISALDDKANRVVELGTADVPIVIVGNVGKVEINIDPKLLQQKPTAPAEPYEPRPLYLQWWAWGGAAVVFGGLGTYFGIDAVMKKNDLETLNANSPNHTFDEAKDLESSARRSVLFTNIAYGAAGAFAIGAGILWLTAPSKPATESATKTSVVPIEGGGASVVVGGRF